MTKHRMAPRILEIPEIADLILSGLPSPASKELLEDTQNARREFCKRHLKTLWIYQARLVPSGKTLQLIGVFGPPREITLARSADGRISLRQMFDRLPSNNPLDFVDEEGTYDRILFREGNASIDSATLRRLGASIDWASHPAAAQTAFADLCEPAPPARSLKEILSTRLMSASVLGLQDLTKAVRDVAGDFAAALHLPSSSDLLSAFVWHPSGAQAATGSTLIQLDLSSNERLVIALDESAEQITIEAHRRDSNELTLAFFDDAGQTITATVGSIDARVHGRLSGRIYILIFDSRGQST